MIFPVLISVGVMLLYMLKIGMYRHFWNKFPAFEHAEQHPSVGISVVVAFRNEEDSLPGLLYSLDKQTYPEEFREFILVNDHSCDRSRQIAENFACTHPGFRCFTNEKGKNGKKAAVLKGVHHAAFSVIVITDADCTMGESWLSAISAVYSEQSADLVIGLVDVDVEPGIFNHFQEIEFLSLVASGAAAAAGGNPIYCNAANLAFKKDLFLSYADPLSMAVPSGDDTLFMLRVKENPAHRIVLLKSLKGMVTTNGARSPGQFLDQRSRWASKSRYYTDTDILYTACLVLGMSMALLFSAIAMVLGRNAWLFPGLLAVKCVIDFLFLRDFLRFYRKGIRPGLFVLFEIVYPLYILITAVRGIFNRYTWKGRAYQRETV